MPFGCGQCLPCRISRRRLWTHRLILETFAHKASSFVTLTYDKEHLPAGNTLVPRDVELWLMRVRKKIYPRKIRYYLVGEYGDETQRPHYHVALFGLGIDDRDLIHDTWGKGHILVGDLNKDSAQYIVGYVTKGMTKWKDSRLNGRYPEFARMSRKPGIGAHAVAVIVSSLSKVLGTSLTVKDIPFVLSHGNRKMPLGRYLRRLIREQLKISEADAKAETALSFSLEMCELFKDAFRDQENLSSSMTAILVKRKMGELLNIESRYKIHRRKGKL